MILSFNSFGLFSFQASPPKPLTENKDTGTGVCVTADIQIYTGHRVWEPKLFSSVRTCQRSPQKGQIRVPGKEA